MMYEILNIVKREVERGIARYSPWAIGTLTSYDPDTHAGKVNLQPEDTQTGWLPINSAAVGNDFGICIGPTIGISCLIHFQDGSREAGVILGFFFSDAEKPIAVKEGEIVLKSKFGQSILMKDDGSILLSDKSGATFGLDGLGNITMLAKSGAKLGMNAAGDLLIAGSGAGHVLLGGEAATQFAARNGDIVNLNAVVASSTKVKVL